MKWMNRRYKQCVKRVRKLFFKENFIHTFWRLYIGKCVGRTWGCFVTCVTSTWQTFYFEKFSCYTIDWTIYLSNLPRPHFYPHPTYNNSKSLMKLNKEFIVLCLQLSPDRFLYTKPHTIRQTNIQTNLYFMPLKWNSYRIIYLTVTESIETREKFISHTMFQAIV